MWGGQGPYKDCRATDDDDDESSAKKYRNKNRKNIVFSPWEEECKYCLRNRMPLLLWTYLNLLLKVTFARAHMCKITNNCAASSYLLQLYTDRHVVHAVHKAAILHSKAGHRPIYRYNFAYRGRYSYADLAEIGNTRMNLGEFLQHFYNVLVLFTTSQWH
jgi:hypothetical protein